MNTPATTARCPNCSSEMQPHRLPAHYGANVVVDSCKSCNALWFDEMESTQLSSDGVVELFRVVHDSPNATSPKWSERLGCVRCKSTLRTTHDVVGGTRFNYLRCESGHGRLSSFYQFLTEKKFVRELSAAERGRLAAEVREIRCSGCGAPVDLGKASACEFCRAPISVFDRNAAQKAIDHYLKERKKQIPTQAPPYATHPPVHYENDYATYHAIELAGDVLWALSRFALRAPRAVATAGSGTATGAMMPTADEAIGNTSAGLQEFVQNVITPSALGEVLPDVVNTANVSDMMSGLNWSGAQSATDAMNAGESLGDLSDNLADGAGESLFDLVGDGLSAFTSSLFD